jgi:hypothetical protein
MYDNARRRCSGKDHKSRWYAGRGIKMLMKLKDVKFLWDRDNAAAMAHPSLDRINKDGHYSLDNCRIIELAENRNRRWQEYYANRSAELQSKS